MNRLGFLACFAVLAACGDDTGPEGGGGAGGDTTSSSPTSSTGTNGTSGSTTGGTTTGNGGGGGTCNYDPGPADKDRFVVVGHPNDDAVDPDGSYEVLALSSTGELTETGVIFHMGPPSDTEIVFSPDGQYGFAAQDDGTVGVFRLDAAGQVTVLAEALEGEYYANSVRWNDELGGVYVTDTNFPKNGGGVYTITLACDGTLTPGPRLFESKSARDLFFDEASGDMLLAARAALGSQGVAHVHRITLGDPPQLLASEDAFGDDDAITSWVALTRGGSHLILGDNSAFSAVPNRVASVQITPGGLGEVQVLDDIEDPYSIAVSPYDDAIVVTSGFGDAIFVLDYDPAAAQPLTLRGELAGSSPQLPGALATVARGMLDGHVLIADVRGVYRVQFGANAMVTDLGIVDLGGEIADIVAGVGVQP